MNTPAPRWKEWLWIAVPVALAIVLWLHAPFADGSPPAHPPSFPRAELSIKLQNGQVVPFHVELATTRVQAAYGLMFRRSLAPDAGMLFLFDPDQMVYMWMKNTTIPLDMLFVRGDGTVVKIVHAKPLDTTIIPSGEAVRGVIEIGGGIAVKDGIKPGDKVLYPAFGKQP
ncbi:MAG TPA: DUF192 domain-containing protein [Alphaproteobacteria bacterium]|nr:DUF192 domain-containing protein [Alphaproteobacteria bacterium]